MDPSSTPASSISVRSHQLLLSVGTRVSAKFGPKKPFTKKQLDDKRKGKRPRQSRDILQGVVVRSAPESSWIVYFYDIGKTARVKYNKLTVCEDTDENALSKVKFSQMISSKTTVDFEDYQKLQNYVDKLNTTHLNRHTKSKTVVTPSHQAKKQKTSLQRSNLVSSAATLSNQSTSSAEGTSVQINDEELSTFVRKPDLMTQLQFIERIPHPDGVVEQVSNEDGKPHANEPSKPHANEPSKPTSANGE